MSYIAAKVFSDDNMPGRTMSSVEFLLDLRSDVFLDVVFLESSRRDLNALLLHLLTHVHVFNDSLGPVGRTEISWAGASVSGCYCVVCHDSEVRKWAIWEAFQLLTRLYTLE